MKKSKRNKMLDEVIRIVYDSLQSHLKYTYVKSAETPKFHIKCVREYADIINKLSQIL